MLLLQYSPNVHPSINKDHVHIVTAVKYSLYPLSFMLLCPVYLSQHTAQKAQNTLWTGHKSITRHTHHSRSHSHLGVNSGSLINLNTFRNKSTWRKSMCIQGRYANSL